MIGNTDAFHLYILIQIIVNLSMELHLQEYKRSNMPEVLRPLRSSATFTSHNTKDNGVLLYDFILLFQGRFIDCLDLFY